MHFMNKHYRIESKSKANSTQQKMKYELDRLMYEKFNYEELNRIKFIKIKKKPFNIKKKKKFKAI